MSCLTGSHGSHSANESVEHPGVQELAAGDPVQKSLLQPMSLQALPTPLEIKLRRTEKRLDLKFSDGQHFSLPAELLRVSSPSADNRQPGREDLERSEEASGSQGDKIPILRRLYHNAVAAGRRHVGIMGLQPVGRYAIRIQFDDLHHTGLYTWELLYDLGRHKLSRARRYIRLLREQGMSREPARPRAGSGQRSREA